MKRENRVQKTEYRKNKKIILSSLNCNLLSPEWSEGT